MAIDKVLSQSPADFEELLKLLQEYGCEVSKRGKSYRLKLSGWEKAARMDSLGEGYGLEDLRAVLSGKKAHTPRKKTVTQAEPPKVNLLVDIQAKLQAGKGAGYARWAKVFNLKQMAQTMNYLSENNLLEYTVLEEKATAATAHHNDLSAQIKAAEKRMAEIAVLRTHIVNYAKTREVYVICSEETFSQLTGETGYTILDVQFRFGSDEEDVAEVEALFGEGVTFTDVLIQAQQQRGLYYAFATLVYGFLSIIVAITIFHIMNTISMGVSARTRQYGVMRAIGMSNQQLTRMISAEAASYAISGVILGCIFGLLFHWFLYSSLITRTFGNPWSVPWLELCLIIGVILATTALAVRGPARRLHAMSIVENISSQ